MRGVPPWLGVATVGVAGIVVPFVDLALDPGATALATLLGSVLPLSLSLALVAIAAWAHYDERTAVTGRTLGWTLAGVCLIAGVQGVTLLYQGTQGVTLDDRLLTLANAGVFGGLLGLLFGLYDQQRRRAIRDSRRREAERDRMEEFASVVAHDLRNPLSVARGYLPMAREGDEAAFDRIERALDRADRIVDDALALAREGALATDREPVSLSEVAGDAWATTATGDARLAVERDRTIGADSGRLRRLFENLFRNAVEHGSPADWTAESAVDSEGGDDRSRSEGGDDLPRSEGGGSESELTVTVGATERGFYVADDGVGIPEEDRADVLETGYTTGTDGTGFGLAIVARIAEAHAWDVEVGESETGGARFDVVVE